MNLRTAIYRLVGSGLPFCSALGLGPRANTIGIIMAHGIYPGEFLSRAPMPPSGVLLDTLETNLLGLRGFSFIGMDEAVAMLRGDLRFREKSLVLTFDDSLKAHVDFAAPMLLKYGIPATFYLSTDILDHQRPYWWLRLDYALSKIGEDPVSVILPDGETLSFTRKDSRAMRHKVMASIRGNLRPNQCERTIESLELQLGIKISDLEKAFPYGHAMLWDDARELARKGFTVGSHTCSHPNLTLLPRGEIRLELENSKKLIEERCGVACRHFCYPYGLYSNESSSAVMAAGYRSAVTTDSDRWCRRGDDPSVFRRFGLPRRPHEMGFVLSGLKT